jgi:ribosomal protein S18 acetylase RimI-like enzyme
LEQAHPSEPHWYLVTLSVRPEFHRRGLGSQLVAPILERADREQVPCYLETSDPADVGYYERIGFRVANPALAAIPDGPAHVTMRREPSSTTEGR